MSDQQGDFLQDMEVALGVSRGTSRSDPAPQELADGGRLPAKFRIPFDVSEGWLLAMVRERSKKWNDVIGRVVVKRKSGHIVGVWDIFGADIEWWWLLTDVYTPAEIEGIPTVTVDEGDAPTRLDSPGFAACTYQATSDYLKAIWGRGISDEDRRWLARHPNATEGGLPQEYTPTALQELVEPYNIVIDRIRIRQGAFFTGDALSQWVQALGCNPFAVVDHSTTNAEAAQKLGMDYEEARKLWRFDFAADPLRPSVLGERGLVKEQGTQATYGGHARYLAPRSGNGDWFYSIQFKPIELALPYDAPITFPEYVPRPDVRVLQMSSVRAPNYGGFIADAVHDNTDPRIWKRPYSYSYNKSTGVTTYGGKAYHPPSHPAGGTAPATSPKTNGGTSDTGKDSLATLPVTPGTQGGGVAAGKLHAAIRKVHGKEVFKWHYVDLYKDVAKEMITLTGDPKLDTFFCAGCEKEEALPLERLDVSMICDQKYREAWSIYRCPTCKLQFSQDHAPVALERDTEKKRSMFRCPRLTCEGRFYVWWDREQDDEIGFIAVCVRGSATGVPVAH